jgi:hypothetical protein
MCAILVYCTATVAANEGRSIHLTKTILSITIFKTLGILRSAIPSITRMTSDGVMRSLERRLTIATWNRVRLRFPFFSTGPLPLRNASFKTEKLGFAAAECQHKPITRCHRAFASPAANFIPTNDERSHDSARKWTHMELDFFGEPVTFVDTSENTPSTSNAMAALDGFLLCVVSKGKTCTGGGEEGGLEVKSAHSAALAWADALRHAAVWNPSSATPTSEEATKADSNVVHKAAPMLVVVTVAPVLAQAGVAYVKHLDTLLKHTKARVPGLPNIQMYDLALQAVARLNQDDDSDETDVKQLNQRERMHLTALKYLLLNEYPTALATYLRILRSCPGDALALSLAMDLCWTLGDKQSALRYVP